jgi:hypothetical protein
MMKMMRSSMRRKLMEGKSIIEEQLLKLIGATDALILLVRKYMDLKVVSIFMSKSNMEGGIKLTGRN